MSRKIRSKEFDDACARSYTAGETIGSIAKRTGAGYGTIHRSVIASGITPRPHATMMRTIKTPGSPLIRGYIAGMLDGEGHIERRNLKRGSYRCSIYNTNREVIYWIQKQVGGNVRWSYSRTIRKGWKPIGSWSVERSQDVFAFLVWLEPVLIIKRQKAQAMIDHIRNHGRFPLASWE